MPGDLEHEESSPITWIVASGAIFSLFSLLQYLLDSLSVYDIALTLVVSFLPSKSGARVGGLFGIFYTSMFADAHDQMLASYHYGYPQTIGRTILDIYSILANHTKVVFSVIGMVISFVIYVWVVMRFRIQNTVGIETVTGAGVGLSFVLVNDIFVFVTIGLISRNADWSLTISQRMSELPTVLVVMLAAGTLVGLVTGLVAFVSGKALRR